MDGSDPRVSPPGSARQCCATYNCPAPPGRVAPVPFIPAGRPLRRSLKTCCGHPRRPCSPRSTTWSMYDHRPQVPLWYAWRMKGFRVRLDADLDRALEFLESERYVYVSAWVRSLLRASLTQQRGVQLRGWRPSQKLQLREFRRFEVGVPTSSKMAPGNFPTLATPLSSPRTRPGAPSSLRPGGETPGPPPCWTSSSAGKFRPGPRLGQGIG